MKREHWKKLIAPSVITGVLLLWLLVYAVVFLDFPGIPAVFRILGAFVSLALAGVSIYVLVERIQEVRSGEEDDLSQY